MLDWKNIDTIFLDMDGTLLDLHYDNYFWLDYLPKRYAAIKGWSPEYTQNQLEALYQKHHATLNWYCIDFWTEELGIDVPSIKREVSDRVAYRPNAQRFLKEINDHGYDIALVTNAHKHSIDVKLEQTDLADYISEIITSHDFKLPKEDPAFWKALQKSRHFDPERTAFLDDNEAVLKSAREAGIKHLYSIAQPDSRKKARTESEFPLLNDFIDVLPPV